MGEQNYKSAGEQKFPGDDLDRALDAALAKYSAVEPRVGLEERVLANLRAEQAKPSVRSWWFRGAAAALAAVVIVTAVALVRKSGRPSHPAIAGHPSITTPAPERPAVQTASDATENTVRPQHGARIPRTGAHHSQSTIVAAAPKLDHFPSLLPLGVEEMALARYVQSFPSEARLIAQAQEEFELETQKLMNDAGSQIRTSDSIQEER